MTKPTFKVIGRARAIAVKRLNIPGLKLRSECPHCKPEIVEVTVDMGDEYLSYPTVFGEGDEVCFFHEAMDIDNEWVDHAWSVPAVWDLTVRVGRPVKIVAVLAGEIDQDNCCELDTQAEADAFCRGFGKNVPSSGCYAVSAETVNEYFDPEDEYTDLDLRKKVLAELEG